MSWAWLRTGACGAVLLVSAGCWWPAAGRNADRTAYNDLESRLSPANVASLVERWRGDHSTDYGLTGDFESGDPVVSVAGVHVGSGCDLTTLSPSTGTVRWHDHSWDESVCGVMAGSPARVTTVVVADDRLLRGFGTASPWLSDTGSTDGWDPATGEPSGPGHAGVVLSVRGSDAVFGSYDTPAGQPAMVGIGPVDDPAQVRRFAIDIDTSATDALTLGSDLLFQAGAGPLATTAGDGSRGNGVRGYARGEARPGCGPLPAGGTVLVECPLWVTPVDGGAATAPVLGSGGTMLYAGTDAGTLYALDAASGAVVWSTPVGAAVTASPALAGGVLYAPTGDGRVVAVDAATGAILWQAGAGTTGAIAEQPAVGGGLVFTGATDGWVRAFDAAGCGAPTCGPLWSAQPEPFQPITGAPAVSGGQVYVGTGSGTLVAYGLPAG
jgi:outer membrane protein assembly factor BamB